MGGLDPRSLGIVSFTLTVDGSWDQAVHAALNDALAAVMGVDASMLTTSASPTQLLCAVQLTVISDNQATLDWIAECIRVAFGKPSPFISGLMDHLKSDSRWPASNCVTVTGLPTALRKEEINCEISSG